jgi:hypothetical protein
MVDISIQQNELRMVGGPFVLLAKNFTTWPGHVTRMWENVNGYKVLVGKPEGKRQLVRPCVNDRTILKWILKNKTVGR